MCRILITKAVDFLNAVPFREKVSWFRLRIIPLFTFNRWCASHKTFSFLTSSFLGFGSIRWIWHITHKIQEDSISKKQAHEKWSYLTNLLSKSDLPALLLATKMGSSANSSSFLILCLCLLVFTQKSLAYFVTVSFWSLFDFDMTWKLSSFCPKILVWEVILHLYIYLSLLSLFFCYNNCKQVHRFFFYSFHNIMTFDRKKNTYQVYEFSAETI